MIVTWGRGRRCRWLGAGGDRSGGPWRGAGVVGRVDGQAGQSRAGWWTRWGEGVCDPAAPLYLYIYIYS